MATKFENIGSKTEIGTLTLHTASGDVKFGSQDFTDKTVDITTGGSFDPTEINRKLTALEVGKQDNLISGINIKTINGSSILGSGDLEIQGGGGEGGGGSDEGGVTPEGVQQMIDDACDEIQTQINALDLRTGNLGALANYNLQVLTKQEYDNLQERDSHTFYCIVDDVVSENDNDDE